MRFRLRRYLAPKTISALASVAALCTGIAVVLGWELDIPFLKSIVSQPPNKLPDMMPVTAVALILAGLALGLSRDAHVTGWRKSVASLCAGGVAFIGLSMLLENAFCFDLGIDRLPELLLGIRSDAENYLRPSFIAGLSLLLIGIALLTLDVVPRRAPQPAQVLALICFHIACLALLGFTFGNKRLYTMDWTDTGMSLHTALVTLLLSLGIMCARPTVGFTAIMLSRAGGGVVARRLVLAPVSIPVVIGLVAFAGRALGLSQEFSGWAFAAGLLIASTMVIWWVAGLIEAAEAQVRSLNASLEKRVEERTLDLAEAIRDLQHKNQENEMFVYSVSHDLRSPLVNLQGFSKELELTGEDLRKVLNDPAVPETLRDQGIALLEGGMVESTHYIQTGVSRLSNIIDALLRLSRVGRVEYQVKVVDVQKTVQRIVESLQVTITQKHATVTVQPLAPVWGDAVALEQMFANLINNALNYLDPKRFGTIEVGMEAKPPTGDETHILYYVRDNGLGIADGFQEKLFQAFKRGHPSVAPGEGMGLAIVRRIVERHRGKVWVVSTEGAGSTFYVSLPRQKI